MKHVVALDQGTTSSRALVIDQEGRVAASAQREFRQIFPQPGWVEHDPSEIWTSQRDVAAEALASARIGPSDVAAIGIANQRETSIVWDRATGEPIANGIVWQDRRTAAACDTLRARGAEPLIREKTGLVLDAYFSGTKIAWLLDNFAGARERAEKGELAFGTVDTWLVYKLTGGALHATDPSNASRTMLYDIGRADWDDELLELIGVPRPLLPDVVPSSGVVGEVSAVEALHGVPIAGLVGDQQAAMMGQICTRPGRAKNTYGTGCFLLQNTGPEPRTSDNELISTILWRLDGQLSYALEGSVFTGGSIVQWLRDGLGLIRSSDEVEALARSVPDNGGVTFVPALTGLGAPHWDADARGSILGLTRGTEAGHVARAALEGIAHQVNDLARAMSADAGGPMTELRVDGGAAANDLLLQLQADLSRLPVVRPRQLESTAFGAAYMAGLACGVFPSLDEIESRREIDRVFEPRMPESRSRSLCDAWREGVRRTIGDRRAG